MSTLTLATLSSLIGIQPRKCNTLDDGGIDVSATVRSQSSVYDAEYLFFRDENGEYERIATTFGEVITSDMWSDSESGFQF